MLYDSKRAVLKKHSQPFPIISTKNAFQQARGQLSTEANMPVAVNRSEEVHRQKSRAHLRLKTRGYTQTKEKQAAELRSSHAQITKQSHVILPRNLQSTRPADSQNVRRLTKNNHFSLSSAAAEGKALHSFIKRASSEKKAFPSFIRSPSFSLSQFPTPSNNLTFSFVPSALKQNTGALHRSTLDQKVVALESISKAATQCASSCYLLGNCEPAWKCVLVALGTIFAAILFVALAVTWFIDIGNHPSDTWSSEKRSRMNMTSRNLYCGITQRQSIKDFKKHLQQKNDGANVSPHYAVDVSSDDSYYNQSSSTSINLTSDKPDFYRTTKIVTLPNANMESKIGGRRPEQKAEKKGGESEKEKTEASDAKVKRTKIMWKEEMKEERQATGREQG